MMTREFSILRRRKNLVDIITPKRDNVKGYRFKASPNFDGTFTTIITADISSGYLDPHVNAMTLEARPGGLSHIRVVFDPATFNAVASILDANHFWLKFAPLDYAGVEGTNSAPTLVVTDDELRGAAQIIIAGTAPSAADSTNALLLNLPFKAQNIQIRSNEGSGGNSLFVATDLGKPEMKIVAQGADIFLKGGATPSLAVRGGGGTAAFSASFVIATSYNV